MSIEPKDLKFLTDVKVIKHFII